MVYQETASLISVIEGQTCSVRKPPPPAFLFPNQRCQRPARPRPNPPFYARRRRGAAYLENASPCVNRRFSRPPARSRGAFQGAKIAPGPPRATLISPERID